MPVVSKKEFKLPPEFGGKQYIKINFSARSNLFSIVLPDVMKSALGVSEVTGSSVESVEKAFQKVLDDFKANKLKKRKVILLKCDFSMSGEHIEDAIETGLDLHYVLAQEQQFSDREPDYFLITEDDAGQERISSEKFRAWNYYPIPWTLEREKLIEAAVDHHRDQLVAYRAMVGLLGESDRYGFEYDEEATVDKIDISVSKGFLQ